VSQLNDAVADASTSSNRYFKATGKNDGSDDASATGTQSTASGANAKASADGAVALGASSTALGVQSTAVGFNATAAGNASVALGANSFATGFNSVALGNGSVADRANSVSVGRVGGERQITNVAAGTADTDAVNVSQLKQMGLVDGGGKITAAVTYDTPDFTKATLSGTNGTTLSNVAAGIADRDAVNMSQYKSLVGVLGGGASLGAGGALGSPQYIIQNNTYYDVGSAFDALNGTVTGALGSISTLNNRVDNLQVQVNNLGTGNASPAPADPALAASTIGTNTTIGNDTQIASTATNATAVGANTSVTASNAVAIGAGSVADQANTVSVGSAGAERQITNVAAGVNGTDAVNVTQMTAATQSAIEAAQAYADTANAQTLNSANAYTDQKTAGLVTNDNFNAFRDQVNSQFHSVNQRLNRVGAMGSAMAGMAGAIAAAPGTDNRVSAAAGTYAGQGALAVGIARRIPGNGAVLVGGSIAGGGESSGTVGVSFGW
jgi:trimeric autotransporter adhesin